MLIGLLSDAHGNVEAYGKAVALLRREGAERLFFLGDAVGYFPGDAVVRVMLEMDVTPILGNHEAMLLEGDVVSQREPVHRLEAVYRLNETRRQMSQKSLDYIRRWPSSREIVADCGPLVLLHGSPDDPTYGYVFPDSDLSGFGVTPGTTVFMGNTHRPFVRRHGGAMFVNIGSCGLPRDCGTLGAACLFDSLTGEATIIRFDIAAALNDALVRCGPVHESVRALFERRPNVPLCGKVIDG